VTRNKNTAPRPARPTPSTPAPRRPQRRTAKGGSAPRAARPTSGGLTSVPRRARPRVAPLGGLDSLAVRLHFLSLRLLSALARLALAAQLRCAALLATLSHEARPTLALTRRAILTCSAWCRPHRGRVRVHVFHAQRHERIALEQLLRNALRQLERLNGALPPGQQLVVIAHYSLNAPASGPSRSLSLRPEGGARPTILIELALHADGRRLGPSEVLSQLVSCYIALTASRPPHSAGGATPFAGDAPAEGPDNLPLGGALGGLDRAGAASPSAPSTPGATPDSAPPIGAAPSGGSPDGSTPGAALPESGGPGAGGGEASVDRAAADPHGLLHIVDPGAGGGSTPGHPAPSPAARDARGRWVRGKDAP
jgi:hypothetical protein